MTKEEIYNTYNELWKQQAILFNLQRSMIEYFLSKFVPLEYRDEYNMMINNINFVLEFEKTNSESASK